MTPCVEATLRELEAEYATAEQRAADAHLAHISAEQQWHDAIDRRNALYSLLSLFREYAVGSGKDGAA